MTGTIERPWPNRNDSRLLNLRWTSSGVGEPTAPTAHIAYDITFLRRLLT